MKNLPQITKVEISFYTDTKICDTKIHLDNGKTIKGCYASFGAASMVIAKKIEYQKNGKLLRRVRADTYTDSDYANPTEIEIIKLNVSNWAKNPLLREGYKTVLDIIDNKQNLLKLPLMGKYGVKELSDELAKFGIEL